jgi:hypothetical protein
MIMNVTLTRRWGVHNAGKLVEVSPSEAAWLVDHNYAESAGELVAPEQPAAVEGGHGADPLAGGDGTRRRPHSIPSTRRKAEGVIQPDAKAPPFHRAGFDAAAAEREGEVGRDQATDDKKPARHRRRASDGS